VTLYMNILIFNKYKTFRTTATSHTEQLLIKISSGIPSERIYPSPLSSPANLSNLVILPSPYLMMMKLGWTRMMDEFFLSIFNLKLKICFNLKLKICLYHGPASSERTLLYFSFPVDINRNTI
jgi:hypothetical protein